MVNVRQVSDYIIFRLKSEGGNSLDTLKHQKLLYYVQAWHLVFNGTKMFESEFQAWIHGPVNREIYNLYRDKKYLYSEMHVNDILNMQNIDTLTSEEKIHIDNVLDAYAKFSSTQLEHMTHNEKPWIEAREGYGPYQRCEVDIDTEVMKSYYSARLS
ncbi:type II toxin-antitoxin system antitoxin SocA domain-containing protein [Flavobacterium sp.]|uniref:Panacea domain-containing protein n=1 Tax=Flavobacterium sp. TaxID=239 RepID=UPI0031D3CDA8